ncbi:MAG: hypothetical protein JWP19_511 [Rhodoglobus sp.]|jgi:hypothetical protein|nr:hypothetical protein [Rhodoglobus sp.]
MDTDMNTLDRELDDLIEAVAPPLIDLEQLERLVTEDDLHLFDGECFIHDSCRPVR